jgi:hypothetical protein
VEFTGRHRKVCSCLRALHTSFALSLEERNNQFHLTSVKFIKYSQLSLAFSAMAKGNPNMKIVFGAMTFGDPSKKLAKDHTHLS